VTVITCVQAIFNNSLKVGGVALVAFALCYFGTAGFVSSFRARLQKNYKPTDLLGIGVIAVVLCGAGLVLVSWSEFWISFSGVGIEGLYWALLGILIATLTTKKEHALM